jgi:two-component system phosphate regulon sensor histidine kinase PhoR
MGIFHEERFLSLAERMHNGLILINDEGFIEYVNPIFKFSFGNKQYIDEYFNDVIQIIPLKRTISDCYLMEKEIIKEIEYNEQYFNVVSTPLFENEIFKGALIITNDITEIKRKADLERKFFADASHELKTPVAAIKGASEILMRDENLPKDIQKEFTEMIFKENERLNNIIEDLLDISKLERKGSEMVLQSQRINVLVNEVFSTVSQLAKTKDIKLVNKVENGLILEIDYDKFRRMLLNLIKNAINYTDHGEIIISSKIRETEIELNVTDTGVGIANEELLNIFERFYRLDNARSRDTGGTGLGLPIVKSIIERHNGTIDVTSKEGKGTTFHIRIPR